MKTTGMETRFGQTKQMQTIISRVARYSQYLTPSSRLCCKPLGLVSKFGEWPLQLVSVVVDPPERRHTTTCVTRLPQYSPSPI